MLMKILFLAILISSSFLFPLSSSASHLDLKPCIEVAHCVREEWEVNNIEEPFEEIKLFNREHSENRDCRNRWRLSAC